MNTPRSKPSVVPSYSTPSNRSSPRHPLFSSPSSSLYGLSPRQNADTEPLEGDPVSKKECVRVAVRLRPSAPEEDQVWTADSLLNRVHMEAEFNKNKQEIEYLFDRVFTGSDNTVVYEESVRDFIRASMEGFNATCFCAGQTATGKTFTMMGTDSQPGVIPQAVDDVFAYIRQTSGDREFLLRVSYVEIYNETIRDLLAPEVTDLRIHEDQVRGVYVSPLKEEIVTTAKQVMRIIQKGEVIRRVSQTDYNTHSSRSHTIFQMIIESRDRLHSNSASPTLSRRYASPSGKGQGAVRVSHLNLIDLAGSEKVASSSERRKEGAYINKSLLTLGTVISKLTEEKNTHVPYRDSKLTRILQSSLSGNARVSVICTIALTASNAEESHNTLKFASRLKKVVTRARTNEVLDDKALLQKYKTEIRELKTQLVRLNENVGREKRDELSEVELLKMEKRKYEEDRMEMQLVRTALKERIDHLTKMILTSSTITSKPILDWSESGTKKTAHVDPALLSSQLEHLQTTLAEKERTIIELRHKLARQETSKNTVKEPGDPFILSDPDRVVQEQRRIIAELELELRESKSRNADLKDSIQKMEMIQFKKAERSAWGSEEEGVPEKTELEDERQKNLKYRMRIERLERELTIVRAQVSLSKKI